MKHIKTVVLIILLAGIIWLITLQQDVIRGLKPAVLTPPKDIAILIDERTSPLQLPEGFTTSILADNLTGARVLALDETGALWVSQKREGVISRLIIEDDIVIDQQAIFTGLNNPHGLAFDPQNPSLLYVAEEDALSRVETQPVGELVKIANLPSGRNHTTRTIGFDKEGKLLISIGSNCNVCREENPEHAAIIRMNTDGSEREVFASGLRNAVFFITNPFDGSLWATEMGRDLLGDDTPPDEINIIEQRGNYGWPICYGKGSHDTDFDKNVYIRNPCEDPTPSHVDIQAHSAPLGLAFVDTTALPAEYFGDLLVAYHGSWNRTVPTGYKIVRMQFNADGTHTGTEDFITGWLQADGSALGRPVDILITPEGVIYISDDKAGVIYAVKYVE